MIGLERIDIQEEITVEALLDSGATGLVMSSEFARKQEFKLKKLDRPMYVRNVDSSLNKEGPIVMKHFGHGQFLFSDFIGILFFFSFLFSDDEEARDIVVT